MLKLQIVTIDQNNMDLKFLDGDNDMGEEINKIIENSGITIKNVTFPVTNAYLLNMAEFGVQSNKESGVAFECGHIVDYINILLEQVANNSIIIIDFTGIDSISEEFSAAYTKLLLNTTSKIISINMSVSVYRNFNSFVAANIQEVTE